MLVSQMAHVRFIDVSPNEPTHRTAGEDIRSEMFLRRDARRTHYPGEAVRSYANDLLVLVLMRQ